MATDNELLVLIQADVKEIHDRIMQDYSAVSLPDVDLDDSDLVDVTATLTTIRAALPSCQKAVVTNMGPDAFNLFEEGKKIGRLFRYDTWESPLAGILELTAQCDTGSTAKAAVASYIQP